MWLFKFLLLFLSTNAVVKMWWFDPDEPSAVMVKSRLGEVHRALWKLHGCYVLFNSYVRLP